MSDPLLSSLPPPTLAQPAASVTTRAVRTRGEARKRPTLRDGRLAERFTDEDRRITLRNVRTLCLIAMVLVPCAFVLDWFAYRDHFAVFLGFRLLSSLCLVPVLYATHTSLGQRYFRAFTVLVPMIPAFFISLMIRQSGDPASSYYAGLTLCIVAIGLMFHWTFKESGFALILTIIFYLSANAEALWRGVSAQTLGTFINNCVFILLNGVVILSGSFYHHRIRVREFLVRAEVEEQREELERRNDELVTTLQQLRETETQLFQSEKLASLGRMSAGIIHEINNPLNFANQALFVLKKKGKFMPEEQRESFERIVADIKEGIGRVSTIASDLRSFSHADTGAYEPVNLAELVQNAERLMMKELKDSDVTLFAELAADAMVVGDRNQIIQVLINLIQNAVHALQGREQPRIDICAEESAERVFITVRDNGCGIPADNIAKVFDPFFTTKDVGEGMGMGLSVCFRMITQMGGTIEVASSVGEWTQFTLSFTKPPAADDAESAPFSS